MQIFCYDVKISPEAVDDSFFRQTLMKIGKRRMEMLVGHFVIGGHNIFTTTNLDESLKFNVNYKD